MDAKYFSRMLTYDAWANRECLAAMRAAGSVSADTLGRMAHMLSAQRLWLERLQKSPQTMPVWPTLTIEDCLRQAEEVSKAWLDYVKQLEAPSALDREIEYRNSKGELWSSRVQDVVTHVLFHSAYHRGQIALQLRASGAAPALTDFIHAVRQGFVD